MPKMLKRQTKKSAKKDNISSKRPSMTTINQMEKDFKTMPAKIVAFCRAEMKTVKQQEMKVKKNLSKAVAQGKLIEKKFAVINKTNSHSSATKKQILAAKKKLDLISKTVHHLTIQLEQLKKLSLALAAKQSTMMMINKQLAQLQKEIAQKQKTQKKPTMKKRAMKKTRQEEVSTHVHEATPMEIPTMESTQNEPEMA